MDSNGKASRKVVGGLLLGLLVFYGVMLLINSRAERVTQDFGAQARERINTAKEVIRNSYPNDNTISLGSSSGFEGPAVSIHAIEWGNRSLTESRTVVDSVRLSGGMFFLKGTQASFDPDHPQWGLPNFHADIGPVAVYQPTSAIREILQTVLPLGSTSEGPYRTYRKKLLSDNPEAKDDSFIEMQLWLTSFNVRIEIRPDVRTADKPANAKNITYPAWFYGEGSGRKSLDKLEEEKNNYRFGDLNVVMRVVPNNAPWYVKTKDDSAFVVVNEKPRMAVAALHCSRLEVGNEKDERRVGIRLQTGSALTFYPQYQDLQDRSYQDRSIPQKLNALIEEAMENKNATPTAGIWEQPQYAWIHFDNIGSWKSGNFFSGRHIFADYIDADFILFLLVQGKWDVRLPPGLTNRKPLPPIDIRKPGLIDRLIPDFHLGIFGRLLSGGVGAFVLLLVLSLFFPPLLQIVNVILSVIGRIIGGLFGGGKSG